MIDEQKCAVIGCGFVGASIAYSYAESGLFSEMVLLDVNHKKAEGEALDIGHGLPFLAPMKIYAGDYPDLADAGLIVIAAGANQKPGETRLQLLSKNLQIFDSIVQNIVQYNKEAILLVVTNPVDLLTYYTWKQSGYPAARVIGSGTVLDTARLKYMIGRRLSVDPRNVHSFIIGEHGDSEVPVFSSANVSGIDLYDFCRLSGMENYKETLQQMFEEVRDSAYRIIEGKGATYYAIAQAVMRITRSILRDENSVLPVSTLVENHYGVHDICLGVPAIVGSSGVKKVLDLPLDEHESEMVHRSAATIRRTLDDTLALTK
ncbi:MAG: L-lactate dehydrogenase [Clostridia bacterium]|nr:L-lactate dehydrogenase [Clostridia bacterium]